MIDEYGIKDMSDVHEFVKMLTAKTIQAALDAELENDLGYSKYDYKNKNTDNSRNGYSTDTSTAMLCPWILICTSMIYPSFLNDLEIQKGQWGLTATRLNIGTY